MDNSSFIKLHRKLTEWEWYKDLPTYKLFTHLLLKANYEDSRYQGILIKRGEVLTGRIKLAEQTGLTLQQVRTALDKLRLTSEITSKATNKFSVIKLVNYNLYQDKQKQNNQLDVSQALNEQLSNNLQITTSKEEKEIKKKKKEEEEKAQNEFQEEVKKQEKKQIDQFNELWGAYTPMKDCVKGSKKKAEEAYIKIVKSKKHRHEQILQGAKSYLKECGKTNTFTCHVVAFLNQERFTDYDLQESTIELTGINDRKEKLKAWQDKLFNPDKTTDNFKLVTSSINFIGSYSEKVTFSFYDKKKAHFITDTKFIKGNFENDYRLQVQKKLQELFEQDTKLVVYAKEDFNNQY